MKRKITKWLALCLVILLPFTLLTGCGSDKPADSQQGDQASPAPESGGVIHVATKPPTEQYILGEILKQLIEANTDLTVEVTTGIAGGTANIQPAMEKGEFDLYPEYTDTGWLNVLKNEPMADDAALFEALNAQYNETYDMSWVGLYGFNNTYELVVSETTAQEYGLETISDLAAVSDQLVFGANTDYFERADGYPALAEAYGFNFKDTAEMDVSLKYQALEQGECDVINAFTTDAQLAVRPLKLLEDDKHFFATYSCSTVVRNDALAAHPELKDVLMMLDGAISPEDMQQMNYSVEVDKQDEAAVAKAFLEGKGLI